MHFSLIEWPKKIMTHCIINRQMHYVWGWSQMWWGLGGIGLACDTQISYSQNQKINSRIKGNPMRDMRDERMEKKKEQRRCSATTARGSLRTRRFLFSTRRPSTSSAMSATRSSPPPLAWPSTSSKSTRKLSPRTFACHLQFFFLRQFPFMCGIVGIYIGEWKLGFFFSQKTCFLIYTTYFKGCVLYLKDTSSSKGFV